MANYIGMGKTNYFAVKDIDAFREEVGNYAVEIAVREEGGKTLVALYDNDPDGAGFPYEVWNADFEEAQEIDWDGIFFRHLADGWVAILYEIGYEKYRYFGGVATAFNSKGETRRVSIDDIMNLADEIGSNF